MPRTRQLKWSFFENEVLSELPAHTRLFFQGMWGIADRDGRLEDRPKKNAAKIFPYEEYDGEEGTAALAEKGFITRYEVNGHKYIQINTFSKNQKVHPREIQGTIPAMPGTDKGKPKARLGTTSGKPRRALGKPSSALGDTSATLGEQSLPLSSMSSMSSLSSCDSLPPDTSGPTEVSSDPTERTTSAIAAGALVLQKPMTRTQEVLAVFAHYRTHHPRAFPNPNDKQTKEWALVVARLKEGYSVQDLCDAIDGCHRTPHNIGQNDKQQRYDSLELIMRTGSHVNRFMNAPEGQTVLTEKTQRTMKAAQSWAMKGSENGNGAESQ